MEEVASDFIERWRQPGAAVPLGQLADVRVTAGPPMIKDENGVLVGYVFADIDPTARDLGGWVEDAKSLVASQLTLPPGYRLQWTGQYEFLAAMEARLRYVLPLTLLLIVGLLHLAMRGWAQTFLVLTSLPFAVAGSVWLLAYMDYNLSTAVWVGIIAVAGVAAETASSWSSTLTKRSRATGVRAASGHPTMWTRRWSREPRLESGRSS